MFEIIPNYHPILVHFTVALLSTASLLFIVGALAPPSAAWKDTCLTVARWNLWLGALITLATVLAGWQAYNSVAHDGPSHAAMTDHKNWAFPTAGLFIFLALWAFIQRKTEKVHTAFVVLIAIAAIMLGATGLKGGDLVYRYGLGVMSLPEATGDGGHDSHSHGDDAHHQPKMKNSPSHDDHSGHAH